MIRLSPAILVVAAAQSFGQQAASPATQSAVSAPISDVRYEVTFTRETAEDRRARVMVTFNAEGPEPILLSLPA